MFYLEQPVTSVFDEIDMLPFPAVVTSASASSTGAILHVNLEEQRASLPTRGLFTAGNMIFYNVIRREDRELQYSVGKIMSVLLDQQILCVLPYVAKGQRSINKIQRNCYVPTSNTQEIIQIPLSETSPIQFQLNANPAVIPAQALKKLQTTA